MFKSRTARVNSSSEGSLNNNLQTMNLPVSPICAGTINS